MPFALSVTSSPQAPSNAQVACVARPPQVRIRHDHGCFVPSHQHFPLLKAASVPILFKALTRLDPRGPPGANTGRLTG